MTAKPSTPDSDGPKTETTLTTRIRINIPGSRPIPPVVVRTPMAAEPTPEPAPEPAAEPEPAPAPARAAQEETTSNWFAPRKAATPPPGAGPGAAAPGAPAPGAPAGPRPGAPRPGVPAAGAPAPHATAPGGPATGGPGHGPGAGPAAGPVSGGPRPGAGAAGPRPGAPAGPGQGPGFAPAGPSGPGFAPAPGGGDPGYGPGPAGPGFDTPAQGFAAPPAPRPVGGPGVGSTQGFPAYGTGPQGSAPAGPTGGPALGTVPVEELHPPRWPGPELDAPGNHAPGPAHAHDHPQVPEAGRTSVPTPGPAAPAPAPAKAAAGAKPGKKGRNKAALLGGAVFALLGVAYGAGLLLNHSDVPKGTTVLGVDISGSRDEAVTKLQTAFGNRAAAPLQLTVGGKQVELKPEKAGLTLDSQTTVRNAAGSDYNPVTVIGSLLGQERTAEPVMPRDDEKLQVALQELAGSAGSATEGTITFDTGKAVAVPGKPGTTLDVDGSVELVAKAFRDMVATGRATPVELPVTTKQPVVDQAELDRAMKDFAEPAMSATATVKAGGKGLPFGAKSLPKILSMQVVDGHLVEKYDLEALKATYGNTFDGVLITRGTGQKTAVTPQDVAGALGKALRGKTPAERIVVIDTNPS
ncbi:hypothetical protein [Streptomyces sp. NPDC091268]|uniref:hypothetical protein n=1 Tax=Streptomyces sp. NPDC091268 TaxID=3365979 RepID=UPI0037FF7A9D